MSSVPTTLFSAYPHFVHDLEGYKPSLHGPLIEALIYFANGGYQCDPTTAEILGRSKLSKDKYQKARRWCLKHGVFVEIIVPKPVPHRGFVLRWERPKASSPIPHTPLLYARTPAVQCGHPRPYSAADPGRTVRPPPL